MATKTDKTEEENKVVVSKRKTYLKLVFEDNSGVSSKRISGFIGWLVCLGLLTYSAVNGTDLPVFTDYILLASTTLLGLDSVTRIWKK